MVPGMTNAVGAAIRIVRFTMKKEIHPKSELVKVRCSCGNTFEIHSTACHDIEIEVCAKCHPFFTGKQKIVDSGGRVEAFKKRFGAFKLGGAVK